MKRLVSISLAISMVVGLLSGSVANAQEIVRLPIVRTHPDERAALVALYENTDGDDWDINDNWRSDSVQHCEWYGIKCDSTDRVIEIDLHLNNLYGQIPPSSPIS